MPGKTPPPRRAAERGTFGKGKWNEMRRPRGEHLSKAEVETLYEAAGKIGRHRLRDSALVWIGFVHGLRASEIAGLKLEQYDFRINKVTILRAKKGITSIHDVDPRERKLLKELVGDRRTGHVFLTEKDGPLTTSGILKIVARAGEGAVDGKGEPILPEHVHPHMLRHACGYWLNDLEVPFRSIQVYLGHANSRHTETYTKLSPTAFKKIKFG
jgi:integrase